MALNTVLRVECERLGTELLRQMPAPELRDLIEQKFGLSIPLLTVRGARVINGWAEQWLRQRWRRRRRGRPAPAERHTPGPWQTVTATDQSCMRVYGHEGRFGSEALKLIALCAQSELQGRPSLDDESPANACLMAATPALYHVVRALEWSFTGGCPVGRGTPERGHGRHCILGDALARAGEVPS
jgi:hypothetical protein